MHEIPIKYQLAFTNKAGEKNAKISFAAPTDAHFILRVLNSAEEEVRLLLNEMLKKGPHSVALDFNQLPSAIYKVSLIAETEHAIDKETLIIKL